MQQTLQLIAAAAHEAEAQATPGVLAIANDADPLEAALEGVQRIDLHFPKFSDGRAFSQAHLLRRRRGFAGEIRATGDVLVDQLVQMQRAGFTSAVLRADQKPEHVQRQFERYPRFYQGDIVSPAPRFNREAA